MAQRQVATEKWREQPYLHWGSGPALGPELREASQPLSAPWLAGLTFEEDELVGWTVVERVKKEHRLDISPGVARQLRQKTSISGMLGNEKLFLTTHSCASRLVKSRPQRTPRVNVGNQFARQAARDWRARDVDTAWEEADRLTASIRENPWIGISKSLEMTLDWAEFEDGILTSAAESLMD